MKDTKIQNQSFLRNINQKAILKYLMKEKMSCSDLAKRMKLSNTAIAKITEELVKNSILIKQESDGNEVGRRPIMLEINPDSGVFFIVNLAGRQANAYIVNMAGKILERQNYVITNKITIKLLYDIITALKKAYDQNFKSLKLMTVCIATPGKTDPLTGNFLLAHKFFDYKNVNLKKIFSQHFDCEILIFNDIKLALEGERIYGKHLSTVKNAMMLHIGYSVGSALMLNEKIYGGSHGFAGELTGFSLNTLVDSADMFFPKNLNSLISVSAEGILKTVKHCAEENSDSENETLNKENLNFDDVVKAYTENNSLVKNIIEQSAMIWARVIRNMTEFLDIESVIISGEITKFGESFKNIIQNYVNSFLDYQKLKVCYTDLDSEGILLGCINLAITASLNTMIKNIK